MTDTIGYKCNKCDFSAPTPEEVFIHKMEHDD